MKWIDKLPDDVYIRLCNCTSVKRDIPIITNVNWEVMKENGKDKEGYTKEDALVSVFDLLCDNGRAFQCELTEDEYSTLCK